MYERLNHCPSCDHENFDNYAIVQDYSVSQESFALVKCQHCQLVFTNPRPLASELHHYYKSAEYISHTNTVVNPITLLYKLVRNYTLQSKTKLLAKHHAVGSLLDFGCGTGQFLHSAKQAGWVVTGIEPDTLANKQAQELLTTPIFQTLSQLNPKEKYDVITAWHVLEHVADLKSTLQQLTQLLAKNGVLFIAVPNLLSQDSQHYKTHWAALDVPRHLYHFTPASFKKLYSSVQLKLTTTHPMYFDSFYVSMLSEKFKHGKVRYLPALLAGLKSNRSAKKTSNYSSLLYVLRK